MSAEADGPVCDSNACGTPGVTANISTALPSNEALEIFDDDDLCVLDGESQRRPFKDLYSGPNTTDKVLIVFIRHFFCSVRFRPSDFLFFVF